MSKGRRSLTSYNNIYYLAGRAVIEMRCIMRQALAFFALALLLLVICGPCSAAQNLDAGARQMGETAGPQIEGNSPSQTASASGSQADSPSASQMGERSRSHMGETNSLSLNASGGKGAQSTSNDVGRGNVDVQNWRGTASNDAESYPVRLNVETISTLDPDVARSLLSSNLSLEDIRSRLGSGNRDSILRGSIRFSNDSYHLVNVTIESSANKSTLSASLAGPGATSGSIDQAEIAGHISAAISADDLEIARGRVVIDDDSGHSGTYKIELERQGGRGYMWGMQGRES
ncbi:hypothetical protein [Methanothrix soehngenii]|uniref:hypothetical protein n=1 Tax=Methanothrix soehngenii TaxID=2223 RepID=UPI0023F0C42F|nr:hypothetical protein [Methanothrix soehngenii]MCK9587012.1 hypothetical protein [Methanothrix soehngenii]MDD5257044.1 hypothetical protein [Methanothrix soehngenii]MDD5735545.1 hypothetical protein [Methanothrix soehngenii]